MSLQPLASSWNPRTSALRGMGLSLGVALLLGSGSANALTVSTQVNARNQGQPIQLAQTSTPPDVIIDTEPRDSESPRTIPPVDSPVDSPPVTSADTRFGCETFEGQYTVMYYPESRPDQSYAWAVPSRMGGGWTAERRCYTISERLESYRPDGLLELRTGVENNYDTLCATTQRDESCRIVLTVPPGQNPETVRDLVFENLTTADSGQQTQGVNTFVNSAQGAELVNQIGQLLNVDLPSMGSQGSRNRSDAINLQPFLDQADGGTATRLDFGVPRRSSSPRLNPEKFR